MSVMKTTSVDVTMWGKNGFRFCMLEHRNWRPFCF